MTCCQFGEEQAHRGNCATMCVPLQQSLNLTMSKQKICVYIWMTAKRHQCWDILYFREPITASTDILEYCSTTEQTAANSILIQSVCCYQAPQNLITSHLWQNQVEEASSGWCQVKRSGYQIETCHSKTLSLCNPLVTSTFRSKHAGDCVNKLTTVCLKKMSIIL